MNPLLLQLDLDSLTEEESGILPLPQLMKIASSEEGKTLLASYQKGKLTASELIIEVQKLL